MSSYSTTKSRVLQYIGIILVIGVFAGAYWYFQVYAGVKTNTGAAQPQGTGQLDSGLAGYWALDNGSGTSATDSSTNGNTGTLTNGPTWTTGQIGGAVDFDGTNDSIVASDSTPLNVFDSRNFTVSGWFNRDTFTGDHTILAKRGSLAAGNNGYAVYIPGTGDKLSFEVSDGTDEYRLESVSTFTATGWNHFTITWNDASSTETKLYINGTLEAATTTGTFANVGSINNTKGFVLGMLSDGGDYFDGKLDEIRFYDRTFSADEVSQLYRLTAPTGVNTNLKGYWSFNAQDMSGTTAYDLSGAGKSGTLTNGPTKVVGKVGQAVTFDGTNDYVNVDNTFGFSNTTFTVSSWIKSTSSSTQFIASQMGNTSNIGGWGINTNSNKFGVTIKSSSGANPYAVNSNKSVTDGQWHHVVAVITTSTTVSANNTALLYVDGINDQASPTLDGAVVFAATTETMKIGARTTSGAAADFMNGSIDETRIYNRALTASEIQSLYDLGQSDKSNSSVSQPQGTGRLDSGLAAYFPLDNGSGTSATDASTNGNTGTLTNGPTWNTGQIGGDVVFDGTNDYIEIGSSVKVDNSDRGAISAWVRFDSWSSIDASFSGIFSYGGPGAASAGNVILEQRYFTSTHYLAFEQGNNGETRDIVRGSTALALSTWYHVAVVSDGTTYKLYLNGVPETLTVFSGSNTGDWFSDTSLGETDRSVIGARYGNGGVGAPLGGALDEVRIYNRTLADDEVAQLYRLTTPTGVDTSLKGYWSFNAQDMSGTTAYDRSGAGKNGTLTNGPTKAIGKAGQAVTFDGSNDYVNVDNTFGFSNTTFTVSSWVKSTSSSTQFIASQMGNTTNIGGWGINTNSNKLGVTIKSSSGANPYAVNSNRSVADGQWHHVAAVITTSTTVSANNTALLYVDGINDQASPTLDGGVVFAATTETMKIGARTTSGAAADFMNGSIDETRIYNRALTAAEIKGLYDAGESDKTNSSVSQPQGTGRLDSGLAGYWKMDENTGTSATDSSTNGNTGTLTNGPTWTTGQIGSAVNFDGTDDYISMTASNLTAPARLSGAAWVKVDDIVSSEFYPIFSNRTVGNAGWTFQIFTDGTCDGIDCARIEFVIQGIAAYTTTVSWVRENQWTHLAFSWDGSNVTFYVNGQSIQTISTGSMTTGSTLYIGTMGPSGLAGYYMDGSIDEGYVYDRALSADEVVQLYRLNAPTGTETGLKGYWSFNGQDVSGTTAYDRSGAGNTGTLTNGPTKVIGKIGQGLSLDGSNDYVSVGTSTLGITAGSTGLTLASWVKVTTFQSYTVMIGKSHTSTYGGWQLNTNADSGNRFGGGVNVSGTWTPVTSASTYSTGIWYHVSMTYDGAALRLYVNGVLDNTVSAAGTIQYATSEAAEVNIGRNPAADVPLRYLTGSLDEVRIYNRTLSVAEITALYNQSR